MSQSQAALSQRERRARVSLAPAPMSIVHVCNGLDPIRDGGMVPSILGMTGALAERLDRVDILTPTPSRTELFEPPPNVRLLGPETNFKAAAESASVLHLHGLWQRHTRLGAAIARKRFIPYVIAAHGMADPWALRQKYWKKRIYLDLAEKRNLRRAGCLHALSVPEVSQLRALAPQAKVALIPNGVSIERFANPPARSVLETEYPALRDKLIILFLGRLHKKKGLDLLAPALKAAARDHEALHLLLAGPDDGALETFRSLLGEAASRRLCTYVGPVSGERLAACLGASDAFVLPSYSEGFSMAVLEAMAARRPVLITTKCHFDTPGRLGAGIVVEPTERDVEAGLRRLAEMSPGERSAMGDIGRRLVEDEYSWPRQAQKLEHVYQWLIGGGPAPEAVVA